MRTVVEKKRSFFHQKENQRRNKDEFYSEVGRYEKLDEAKEIDEKLKKLMTSLDIEFEEFSCLDQDGIVDYIIDMVEENNGSVD